MPQPSRLPLTLHQLIQKASALGVSDLHLEPQQDHYKVRQRLQGQLAPNHLLNRREGEQWVAALKNAAQVDITQKRIAQDGRFQITNIDDKQHIIDCRLSVMPTLWGEKIVLRLFSAKNQYLHLHELGLTSAQLTTIQDVLEQPHGFVVVTGPTGSGKTRTLYAMLHYLNNEHMNICTIEDPIEIALDGVCQTPIQQGSPFQFSHALRVLLRQDPDVIMLGEIRDADTAAMAIQAAQTGHLVLATLHASHALAALVRLQQLGVDALQLISTLSLVTNQRLVAKDANQPQQERTGVFEVHRLSSQARFHLLTQSTPAEQWAQLAYHYQSYQQKEAAHVVSLDTETQRNIKSQ